MLQLGGFEFNIPWGLTDATNYTFRSDEPPVEFAVATEPVRHGADPAEATLARIRRRAEHAFGAAVSSGPVRPVMVGDRGGAAIMMTVLDTPPIAHRLAAVELALDLVLTLSFTSLASDSRAELQFEHGLASVRFDGQERLASPGYFRAYPSGISLDVPLHLRPPSVVLYLGAGETVRLRVAVTQASATLRAVVAEEAARGARIVSETTRSYSAPGIHGERRSHVAVFHDRERMVLNALLRRSGVADGRRLWIECRGPCADQQTIDQVFETVLSSVRAAM